MSGVLYAFIKLEGRLINILLCFSSENTLGEHRGLYNVQYLHWKRLGKPLDRREVFLFREQRPAGFKHAGIERPQQHRKNQLHEQTAYGAGKRIPL